MYMWFLNENVHDLHYIMCMYDVISALAGKAVLLLHIYLRFVYLSL